MKKFLLDLLGTMFISLVAVPCTVIGLCVGGEIYQSKIEPLIKKK